MFFFLQVSSTLLKVRQVCIRNYHTCKTCSQFKSVLKKSFCQPQIFTHLALSTPFVLIAKVEVWLLIKTMPFLLSSQTSGLHHSTEIAKLDGRVVRSGVCDVPVVEFIHRDKRKLLWNSSKRNSLKTFGTDPY